jgi:hypothetical protein
VGDSPDQAAHYHTLDLLVWVLISDRALDWSQSEGINLRRGADKSLAFLIFLFATQPKKYFLDGLKMLEQRSHKCVELRGGIRRVNTFFFQSHSLLLSL